MNCKDCRYFDTEDGKEGYCQEFIYPVNDRCFCNIDAEPPEKPKPDLVEVVRCKDCIHWKHRSYDGKHGCDVFDWLSTENDYCSFAERGDDAEIY